MVPERVTVIGQPNDKIDKGRRLGRTYPHSHAWVKQRIHVHACKLAHINRGSAECGQGPALDPPLEQLLIKLSLSRARSLSRCVCVCVCVCVCTYLDATY